MKIKKDYVIRKIGNELVVVPINDEAIRFNGIITVNSTGAFLFEQLQSKNLDELQLLEIVLEKYEVEEAKALTDIRNFINVCLENKLIDED